MTIKEENYSYDLIRSYLAIAKIICACNYLPNPAYSKFKIDKGNLTQKL